MVRGELLRLIRSQYTVGVPTEEDPGEAGRLGSISNLLKIKVMMIREKTGKKG